ncbi:prophage endopeptidase tail family protein [Priestia megaterium]|uniref:prophage endopeptidase tail family protein n=1 Tax=Priestia megaterium TaxID=1404 RepID=UPI0025A45C34|nr:prophage endopeptidase tail family protein [Priestia megaterium]MDM8151652.1 prophage endopeptidase tail family protein [Priestia megaterium]
MFVYNLAKTQKERLTDYQQDLLRKWKVNDLNSISFSVFRNDVNKAAFDLLDNEIFIEYDNVNYVIRNIDKVEIGETVAATITAEHEFFWRTMNEPKAYVYTTLADMDRSINGYMDFIFHDMSYTFTIVGSFDSQKIESFGGDYVLALFNKILDAFQCEFEVFDKEIRIYKRIGTQTAYPYRSKHNISDVTKKGTSNNLCTYIKGQGKKIEDKNILKGESKNLESLTGTWAYKKDPYWYTNQVGATFKMMWYGTGIRFWYLQDPSGGEWEFKLDGDRKATLSCWGKTTELKSIDLFMDANEQSHTIVATFKGDDRKNTPSTGKGKSRGWVRHSSTEDLKTFETYRLRKDDEQYAVVAEYTSPLAEQFGIRPQAPIQDEDATTEAQLIKSLKSALNDKIEISYTTTLHDISKMGGPMPKPRYGDSVPFIVEKLNLLIKDVRIMEMDEYPELDESPTIVLGNSRQTYGQAAFNATKAQLDKIYDSRSNKIRENVYSDRIKITTQALINSLTQLEYPEGMGILARDPNDYNHFTVFRSTGLGITKNGGMTFEEAITPLGINTSLLTAGQIKTNNIQIIGQDKYFYWDGVELKALSPDDAEKFVRLTSAGLYVSKGSITIERDDGFKLITNGYANWDFSVDEATPFHLSNGVKEVGRWRTSTNTKKGDAGFFSFAHVSRYLYMNLAFYVENGGNGYIYIDGSGATSDTNYVSFYTDHSIGNNYAIFGKDFVVDLGVPTGGLRSVYVRIKSNIANKSINVRKIRAWMRG